MNKYVITTDDRPPVVFTGDYLGSSAHSDDLENLDIQDHSALTKFCEEADKACEKAGDYPGGDIRRLKLYRSRSGKIILHDERFLWNHKSDFLPWIQPSKLKTYHDLSAYLNESVKVDGTYGYLTHGLMSNIVKTDSEAKCLWIQEID